MGIERTFVGLDVHAWSVTGHGLDTVTGQVWQRKLTPDPAEIPYPKSSKARDEL